MKTLIKKILVVIVYLLSLNAISFAGETVPFFYNLMPKYDSNSIIDYNADIISFELWEDETAIYVNGKEIEVFDNYFELDVTNLYGEQEFIISNYTGEEVFIKYFISNENGLVENFKASEFKNYNVYVTTVDGVKVIYSEKDYKSVEKVIKCLENMPISTKSNLKEIKLLPNKIKGNVAGITNYNKITLYGISKYDNKTIENIIYHEVAHTWAYELIREKILDFSYTDYRKIVELDNNFVSNYSKKAIKNNDDYGEDFAESIAFFLIDEEEFTEEHPARAEFILSILN